MQRVIRVLTVVGSFIVVNSHCDGAESFRERTASHPTWAFVASQLSPSGMEFLDHILQVADESGRMPTLHEFSAMLLQTEHRLTRDDDTNLHFLFGGLQKGQITSNELLELRRAQRSLISTIRINYTVRYRKEIRAAGQSPGPPRTLKCEFDLDGHRFRFRNEAVVEGRSIQTETVGFDGKVVRRLLEQPNKPDYGTIESFQHNRDFIREGNPLLASRLLDYQSDLDEETASDDLKSLIGGTNVFDGTYDRHGLTCILVGNSYGYAYLSIKHSYALVEYTAGDFTFDVKQGKYLKSETHERLTNSDFQEVAPNLWLPKHSDFVMVADGVPYHEYSVDVSSYVLNDKIAASVFDAVIPNHTFVADGVQKTTYWLGGPGKVGDTDTAKNEQSTVPRLFVWTNVIVIAAVVIVIAIRQARVRQR